MNHREALPEFSHAPFRNGVRLRETNYLLRFVICRNKKLTEKCADKAAEMRE